jgi:hypothetical protein
MDPNIQALAARLGVSYEAAQQIYNEGHTAGRAAPRISNVQPRAAEITAQLNREWYHEAQRRRMSFSALLEERDPSDQYDDWVADDTAPGGRRRMDAFERQLAICDIRTRPDVRNGIPAHTVERFYMSDSPASSMLFPEFINRTVRSALLEPSLLDELVAITTLVDGAVYQSFRITDDPAQARKQRVTETAEPRRVTITGAEEINRLYKFGVIIAGSYEVFRRMEIDLFAFHLARIAQQNDLDKAAVALDTLINGDGNAGSAATSYRHQADLAGSAASPLEFKPYIRFLAKFRMPYRATTIFGQEGPVIDLLTLSVGNSNIPLMSWSALQGGIGGVSLPRFSQVNPRVFVHDDSPASKLVAVDRARGLQLLMEVGADLTEVDKIVQKQLNEIVISDVSGFAILDPKATRILDLTA